MMERFTDLFDDVEIEKFEYDWNEPKYLYRR